MGLFRVRPPTRPLPPSVVVPPVYRRNPLVCGLVAVALVAAVIDRGWGGRPADDYTRYHDRVFDIVKVVDGDTFDVAAADGDYPTTRIRLWGVDTPEVAGGNAGKMYFGPEASAFAKRTLRSRAVRIELSPTKTRGIYGRLLAYVYLVPEGDSFNELLIERGFAYADWRFAHPLKTRFKALEKRAQRQGVGLWAEVRLEDKPAWRQRMEREFKADSAREPSAR